MLRVALKYGFALTAIYILAANASNAGQVITAGANGVSNIEKTLQGRG